MNRQTLIKAARQDFIEDPAVAAGRLGEAKLAEYLQQKLRGPLSKVKVWHDIRVPRSDGHGKYEIDYLIMSPYGALVLEVKNFGGRLEIDANSENWIQTTSSHARKIHECPWSLTEKKIAALRAFLLRNGIETKAEHFQLQVVMANPRLLVTSQLAEDPRICSINKLKRSLRRLLPKNPGLFGIARSRPMFSRFIEMQKQIDRLPTWDEIELYGGKILRGDIQKDFRSNLPGRDKAKAMTMLVPRHRFWGRLHPSLYLYQSRSPSLFRYRWIQARRDDELVKIQLAGSQTVTEVKLYNISRLRYGSADLSYYKV